MIERADLQDAAARAFATDPGRAEGWRLAGELGWLMTVVPEEVGGLGLGGTAAAALALELGRVLAAAPLVPALPVAAALGGDATWGEPVMAGTFVAASLAGDRLAGDRAGLSGRLTGVLDADLASRVLAFAPGLAAVLPLAGAHVREVPTWDGTRRLFTVGFDGQTPDAIVAEGADADLLAAAFRRDAGIALAADSLGGAGAALEMTVAYLATRRQFDRPLAMFQALKHRCADLKIAIEAATALLWQLAADPAADPLRVAAMAADAGRIYATVAEEAIQLHGGIGLTEEHPIHRYMKRAMLNAELGGRRDAIMAERGRALLEELA